MSAKVATMTTKKIAVCGPSHCGKDTVCEMLSEITTLRYSRSSSWELVKFYTERKYGLSRDHPAFEGLLASQFAVRHNNKAELKRLGNELRDVDPLVLVRPNLEHGDMLCGPRDPREIKAALDAGLVEAAIWIDRPVPPDPTMEYGIEMCHFSVPNLWGKEELYARLVVLAKFTGMPLRVPRVVV